MGAGGELGRTPAPISQSVLLLGHMMLREGQDQDQVPALRRCSSRIAIESWGTEGRPPNPQTPDVPASGRMVGMGSPKGITKS